MKRNVLCVRFIENIFIQSTTVITKKHCICSMIIRYRKKAKQFSDTRGDFIYFKINYYYNITKCMRSSIRVGFRKKNIVFKHGETRNHLIRAVHLS